MSSNRFRVLWIPLRPLYYRAERRNFVLHKKKPSGRVRSETNEKKKRKKTQIYPRSRKPERQRSRQRRFFTATSKVTGDPNDAEWRYSITRDRCRRDEDAVRGVTRLVGHGPRPRVPPLPSRLWTSASTPRESAATGETENPIDVRQRDETRAFRFRRRLDAAVTGARDFFCPCPNRHYRRPPRKPPGVNESREVVNERHAVVHSLNRGPRVPGRTRRLV